MKKGIFSTALVSVLIVALIGTAVYANYENNQKRDYERYLQNTFQQAFYETAYYVSDIENVIAKIRLTNKAEQSIALFAQMWRQAAAAQETLGRLPYHHSMIDNMQNYLSQTSDFAYTMMVENIDGKNLNDENREKLNQLYKYSQTFSDQLNNMVSEAVSGNIINWNEVSLEEASLEDANADLEGSEKLGSMLAISKEFQEYPSLIYDGPFSAHIKTMRPKLLENKAKITKEEGIQKVKEFLQYNNIAEVRFLSETDEKSESSMPIYTYSATFTDKAQPEVYIDITQQGGYPVLMLNYSDTIDNEAEITLQKAKEIAKGFLDKNGYPNMETSYYENADGVAVINFAPVKNGVTIYSDLIKIKVDMRNGTIVGFESEGYIMMHHDRQITAPILSAAEASLLVSEDFNVEGIKRCIIPLESKEEVYCYEIKGTFENDSFLVYVNANTGKQEQILQLLIGDNAVLTQ